MENRIIVWLKVLLSQGYEIEELLEMDINEIRDLYEEEMAEDVISVRTVSRNGHVIVRKDVA